MNDFDFFVINFDLSIEDIIWHQHMESAGAYSNLLKYNFTRTNTCKVIFDRETCIDRSRCKVNENCGV